MPQVEFEPTIPVFERAKTVHALDREATVIDPDDECKIGICHRSNIYVRTDNVAHQQATNTIRVTLSVKKLN
jgi:hypothetical protein